MKTRSKTTGAPPWSNDTRSDSKAGTPARQPSSRASRSPSRTADTLSRARSMVMPSLNSSTWRSGVVPRSAFSTSSPTAVERNERWRLIGWPSTSRSRSSCTTPARDQVLTLEHLERRAQRHERHPEALRELALVVEPRPRREAAGVDAVAQRLGDAVVTRHPCVHGDSSVGVLELRAARIVAGAPNGTNESNDERDLGATAVTGGIVRPG